MLITLSPVGRDRVEPKKNVLLTEAYTINHTSGMSSHMARGNPHTHTLYSGIFDGRGK